MGLNNTSMRVSFVRRTLPDDALQSDTPLPRRAHVRVLVLTNIWCPLVSPASFLILSVLRINITVHQDAC